MTIDDQIKCARRELALRKAAYPKWVAKGTMKQEDAEREISCMEAIVRSLDLLQNIYVALDGQSAGDKAVSGPAPGPSPATSGDGQAGLPPEPAEQEGASQKVSLGALQGFFGKCGFSNSEEDRTARLHFASAVVGRVIESFSELDEPERVSVYKALREARAAWMERTAGNEGEMTLYLLDFCDFLGTRSVGCTATKAGLYREIDAYLNYLKESQEEAQ